MTDEAGEVAPEVAAGKIGWVPQEQWKGPSENWVDAQEFLDRGKTFIPFLKAANERQEVELAQLRARDTTTSNEVKALRATVAALETATSELKVEQAVDTVADLKTQLRAAREAGDIDTEAELLVKLPKAVEASRAPAPKREEPAAAPNGTAADPAFAAWTAENSWFGQDAEKTSLAMGVAKSLRDKGSTLEGKAFYDAVGARVSELLTPANARRVAAAKVEAGTGGTPAGSSGGGTYADLPADAKAVCDKQAARFVGPGKKFAKVEDWRKAFVSQYAF